MHTLTAPACMERCRLTWWCRWFRFFSWIEPDPALRQHCFLYSNVTVIKGKTDHIAATVGSCALKKKPQVNVPPIVKKPASASNFMTRLHNLRTGVGILPQCTLTDGSLVNAGWHGHDGGKNACNTCYCQGFIGTTFKATLTCSVLVCAPGSWAANTPV